MASSSAAAMLRQIARECRSLPRVAVEEAATSFQKAITKKLQRDTGGDSRLSGAPTKMRVQKKIDGDTYVTAEITPNKPAMSMWVWLDEGTGDPGPTKAKGTWSEPASAEMDQVTAAVRKRLTAVMR